MKLYDYKLKRKAAFFAGIFVLLKLVADIMNLGNQVDMKNLNLYVVLSLLLVISGKEKLDDERTKEIRHFALNLTFRLLVAFIVLNSLFKLNFEVINIVISSLIFYLLIFYTADYYNPGFIFKESTKKSALGNKVLLGILLLFSVSYTYNIISAIINS